MVATAIVATALMQSGVPAVTSKKTFAGIRVVAVAAAPTGVKVAVSSEDLKIRVMDTRTSATIFTMTGHPQQAYGLAFSPNGKYIASGDESGRIYLWNAANGQKIREFPRDRGHTRGIQWILFTKDNNKIVTVGKDDVIKVWNVTGGNPVATMLGSGANFYGAAFTATGALVTGTLAEGMRFYNPSSWQLSAKLTTSPTAGSNGVAANKGGTLLATLGRDGRVSIYNGSTRARISQFTAHADWVLAGAYTPNGKWLFTSGSDSAIKMSNGKTGGVVKTLLPGSFVGSPLVVSSDGATLVATDDADQLRFYNIAPAQLR